jgi:hypothetical protein
MGIPGRRGRRPEHWLSLALDTDAPGVGAGGIWSSTIGTGEAPSRGATRRPICSCSAVDVTASTTRRATLVPVEVVGLRPPTDLDAIVRLDAEAGGASPTRRLGFVSARSPRKKICAGRARSREVIPGLGGAAFVRPRASVASVPLLAVQRAASARVREWRRCRSHTIRRRQDRSTGIARSSDACFPPRCGVERSTGVRRDLARRLAGVGLTIHAGDQRRVMFEAIILQQAATTYGVLTSLA